MKTMKKAKNNRIGEIDFIRGLSLIIMIYYHIIFDLEFIFGLPISTEMGINFWAGKIGIIFIFISGVSSTLSKNKILRAFKLLIIAFLLTLVTFILNIIIPDNNSYIKFGIIHLLSASLFLSILFNRIKPIPTLIIGIIIIVIGIFISKIDVSLPFLFPLGLTTNTFSSLDFFPLFPNFGYFLIGITIGKILYKEKKSLLKIPPKNILNIIGKHSLNVYIIHQPIIFLLLYILNMVLRFI
jgi:uncharacterized membrane protein